LVRNQTGILTLPHQSPKPVLGARHTIPESPKDTPGMNIFAYRSSARRRMEKEANITTETKVRKKSFYLDTACTSRKTPDAGHLPNNTKCSGCVKSGSQQSMDIVSKGDVIMECILRDELVSSFHVCNVLHIPKLEHAVTLWRKLQTKGYSEFGEEYFISINKGTKVMFEAVFDGNLFNIPQILQSALITYDLWNQTLGHLAPSSMDQALKLYPDTNIPPMAKDFICSSCVKSKIVKGFLLSTSSKDRNKLDPVYSGLS
jgi:hypothetical protein